MKTFNDLVFQPTKLDYLRIAQINFNNGYGAVVIENSFKYRDGLDKRYELGVIFDNKSVINPPISTDPPRWDLTDEKQVTDYLRQIQELESKQDENI